VEAVLIAGGKAERLGPAAQGLPKPLARVAGRPLAAYQVAQLAAAGVERVIVSCAAGQEDAFETTLSGIGPEIITAPEPEPLGRGGGLRFAAQARGETGPLYVLNGDELIDVDLGALLAAHREHCGAATIVVAPLPTAFGVVDIDEDDRVNGFQDSPELPFWAHAGVNVFDDEAMSRLPEKGDHESTTLPELAAEGKLYAHRHAGLWLTVNTPKDLRIADDHLRANPDWLTQAART
jgi:NDP-sugar pyrophosphorylase family protein